MTATPALNTEIKYNRFDRGYDVLIDERVVASFRNNTDANEYLREYRYSVLVHDARLTPTINNSTAEAAL